MKSFFEGIGTLFTDYLFLPFHWLREEELTNWWLANALNWIFIIICTAAMIYWIKQLNAHKANNEDVQDTTAHSFLK